VMPEPESVSEQGELDRRRTTRRWAVASLVLLLLFAALVVWRYYSVRESTDDAQIDGHIHSVSARVGGTVQKVSVEDNQFVDAGAPLVQLDPQDYKVALDRARADLSEAVASALAARTGVPVTATTATSQERVSENEVAMARARLASAQSRLREAKAKESKAAADLERIQRLAGKDEVSRQEYDATALAAEAARAELEGAQAAAKENEEAVGAADARLAQSRTGPEQVTMMRARAASADAKVEQARAAVERAELDLEHTMVTAPVSGTVSKRAVETGQIVQPGQPLLALVPLGDVWVTANFKENQLGRMRAGQPVTIKVDASGRNYRGHVDSVAPATGAKFSLLPPENASGNFVKVVQRVPVKIVFDQGQDPDHLLRPGMSVVPTVLLK